MTVKKRKHSHIHVISVGTAVVFFWRGAWGLMDLYIFPQNESLSYLVSLFVGLFILIATHRLVDELT